MSNPARDYNKNLVIEGGEIYTVLSAQSEQGDLGLVSSPHSRGTTELTPPPHEAQIGGKQATNDTRRNGDCNSVDVPKIQWICVDGFITPKDWGGSKYGGVVTIGGVNPSDSGAWRAYYSCFPDDRDTSSLGGSVAPYL